MRNEIIHTKQSNSEERYSKLLSKSIFQHIESHKSAIKFYSAYIKANYKDLLSEIPYNIGYDDLFPKMISDGNFQEIYDDLINKKVSKEK